MTTAIAYSRKAFTGVVVALTVLWSIGAAALISPLVAQSAVALADLSDGDLIMTDGAAAGATVYVHNDGKKYPFPNAKIYASWYGDDFSSVMRISAEDMGSLAWGSNMLYRPGSRLIKVPDDPKVYAVLPGGTVAWVKDEATAQKFYGDAWAGRVDDLLASLFVADYTNDPNMDLTADSNYPDGTLIKVDDGEVAASALMYYYIDGGMKRAVGDDAMGQFNLDYAIEVSSDDAAAFDDGDAMGSGEFLNPVAVQEGTTTPGADAPDEVVADGDLSFSLAADSPTARLLDGTGLNAVLKVAVSGEGNIDELTFKKVGTTANTNITGMRVVDSSGARLGNVVSSINEDDTVTFTGLDHDVDGSDSLELQVDLNTSAGASDARFELTGVDSGASVSGLPVAGFLLDVKDGSTVVTTVTFDLDGPADNSSVQLGNEIEIFNFTLRDTGSKEKSTFDGITLYNNGSVTDEDVEDYKLVAPNGDILATVQQDGKWVVFDGLDYELIKGATKSFKIKATPKTGATRTIDLQLQNDYDLKVMGNTSAHYILATADGSGTNDSTFPVGDASGYTDMTLASGSLTWNKSGENPTSNYAVGEADVILGSFDVKATGEDIEIRKVSFAVLESTSGSTSTSLDGSVFIKADGQTLYSAAFARSMFTGTNTDVTESSKSLSTFLTVPAGETKRIDIVGTIGSAAASTDSYGAVFNVAQNKRLTTGDLQTPTASIVNAAVRSVKAAALTVNNITMAASGTYKIVAGTNGALVGKYVLDASSGGEDVRVNSIVVSQGNGGSAASVTDWSNWRLYRVEADGSETALDTSNDTNTGAANMTFTLITPEVIGKSDVDGVTYHLRANLASAAGASETAVFVVGNEGSAAVGDVTGNSVTESVLNGTSTGSTSLGSTVIITASGGAIKIAVDSANAPVKNSLVNIGTTNYNLGAFTIKAEDEDQKVTDLEVSLFGTASLNDVRNVRLYLDDASTPLAQVTQLTTGGDNAATGYHTWTSASELFRIEAGQTRRVKFLADIAGAGTAKLGNDVRLEIRDASHVSSTGVSTNTASTKTVLNTNSITHTIQPFTVTVAEASPAYPASNLEKDVSTGSLLAQFKITNSGSATITTTQFKIFNNGACTFDSDGATTCNSTGVQYSLKTSAENANSTTNLVSGEDTEESSGVITFSGGGLASSANIVIAAGRYRTFGVYVSGTNDGFAKGASWQLSVATEGDMTFSVQDENLGYDGNVDGNQDDSNTGLKMTGQPSLPSVTDSVT